MLIFVCVLPMCFDFNIFGSSSPEKSKIVVLVAPWGAQRSKSGPKGGAQSVHANHHFYVFCSEYVDLGPPWQQGPHFGALGPRFGPLGVSFCRFGVCFFDVSRPRFSPVALVVSIVSMTGDLTYIYLSLIHI